MALPAWLSTVNPVWLALIATCFTWGVTALGAAMVFLFKTVDRRVLDAMLGFAAGWAAVFALVGGFVWLVR